MCDMGLACRRVCMQAARSDESSWIKVDIAKDPRYPLSWFVVLAAHPSAGTMARLCCSHLCVYERSSAVSRWNRLPAGFLWCSWSMKPQTVGHAVCNPNTVPATSTAGQLERKHFVLCSQSVSTCTSLMEPDYLNNIVSLLVSELTDNCNVPPSIHPPIHPSIQLPVLAAIHNLSSIFMIILSQ